MLQPSDPITTPQNSRWGAASKYAFDDPNKWVTIPSVPLLDEHEMTSETGRPVATVDRAALEEIARNNNKRVYETGDPATLILGHTSDDPRAPEKPAVGFVTNYQVKPFKRDDSGRVIYAIHGDYKLRPQNANLVEEYPRRSVELWWHKKELDPIAMLGGSSPERDLGVVIRNGRINHVTLDHTARRTSSRNNASSSDDVIRFYTHGKYTIESYAIDAPPTRRGSVKRYAEDKMHKVMSEFKEGTLHSGSKSGPKVTSRQQAVAIGMSEAGKSRKSQAESTNMGPQRYNDDCGPDMRYDDASANTDDFDGGGGAVPSDVGEEDNDPTMQKVMQSKWAKGIDSKLDMIMQALGIGGEGGEATGAGAGGGLDEMPPPGAGGDGMGMDAPGGDSPMPGGGDMPGGDSPMPPSGEMDERRMHGEQPVQMNATSTGFAGPGSGYIPGMNGKKGPGRMSRNGSTQSMNGQRTRSRGVDPRDAQIIRLRRNLAQRDAEKIVDDLEREGVIFGRDPEQAQKIKFARVEELTLAILHDEDTKDAGSPDSYVADKIDEMRTCYARRQTDDRGRRRPPQSAGVARYARNPVQDAAAANDAANAGEDEYEPTSDEQVCEMADLQYKRKMPWNEVVKYMRKKYGSLR